MKSTQMYTDPRAIQETDFPATGTPAEQWIFLLNYALLAPSEYNTQPWRFRVQGASVDLFADYSRRLPSVDPDNRELLISCGAACYNLHLAARHFASYCLLEWERKGEHSNRLARLHLGTKRTEMVKEDRLFAAIPHRQSNRSLYEARSVPAETLTKLQACAGQEGTWLQLIQDEHTRKALYELIAAGDQKQWAKKPFRQELARWVRSQDTSATDGLPGNVHAKGSLYETARPFLVRTFDRWREEAARDCQLAAGAPVLAVLGTFADTPGDWFLAGMAGEHLLLEACASGLQTSLVNQPIEVPALRSRLRQTLGCQGFPQLILRIGYGKSLPMTPRRHVQDVLLRAEDG